MILRAKGALLLPIMRAAGLKRLKYTAFNTGYRTLVDIYNSSNSDRCTYMIISTTTDQRNQ